MWTLLIYLALPGYSQGLLPNEAHLPMGKTALKQEFRWSFWPKKLTMRKKEGAKTVSLGDHFGKWCPFSEKRHQTVLIWLRIGRISALLQNGSKIVPQRALFYGPSNVHFGTVYFSQCILPSFHLDPLSFEYSEYTFF